MAPAELEAIQARTPAVMWIHESVHGNEAFGFEAGMQTLYNLAATQDLATLANEPMFRGWWSSLDHLVLNAILLGPARY